MEGSGLLCIHRHRSNDYRKSVPLIIRVPFPMDIALLVFKGDRIHGSTVPLSFLAFEKGRGACLHLQRKAFGIKDAFFDSERVC